MIATVGGVGRTLGRCSLLEIPPMYLPSDGGSLTAEDPRLVGTAVLSERQAAIQRANETYLTSHGLVQLREPLPTTWRRGAGAILCGARRREPPEVRERPDPAAGCDANRHDRFMMTAQSVSTLLTCPPSGSSSG